MTITREQRVEWRRLADATTDGSWYAERRADEYYDLTTVYSVFHNGDTMDRDLVAEVAYDNAEFIAAAREAVPALLDALDQAERERDEAQAAVQRVREMHEPVPVSECTTACSCGWWSHADCPHAQALDGGGES